MKGGKKEDYYCDSYHFGKVTGDYICSSRLLSKSDSKYIDTLLNSTQYQEIKYGIDKKSISYYNYIRIKYRNML